MEGKRTIISDMVIGIKEWAILGNGVRSKVDRSVSFTEAISSAVILEYRDCHPLSSFMN